MTGGLRIDSRLSIPLDEIELLASRSSGPGGQHANVTDSRIEARFEIGASSALSDAQRRRLQARFGDRVTAVAQDGRGQAQNRRLALERLAERIAAELRPRAQRRATRPTRASKRRRLDAKRRQSETKRARRRPTQDD
ncbi:aminoacyl-tRNA hydrolase [Thermoleophilia bacterium SCSIO 60948]|nr:aminoacyl-tRNA hydrolase [Thermoleophilia bacterium SCSIO 60948]